MRVDPDTSEAEHPRLLVAADTGVDPHRLVRLCSDHAGGGAPSVSLVVPVDLDSGRPQRSVACAERLLRTAIGLLEAAGIRLEDIVVLDEDADAVGQLVRSGGFDALLVCRGRRQERSPVLSLAERLARLHGLAVEGDNPAPRYA